MLEQVAILAPIFISSLIAAALLVFGGVVKRDDGSRRWVYLAGGAIATMATLLSGVTALKFVEVDDSSGLFLLSMLFVFVAPFLFWFGFRGRRVGDHPYCRRCGFDLFGRSKGATQCTECGADLNARRAIIIGERRRRIVPIFAGLILLLIGLGAGTPTGLLIIEDQNLQRLKADLWLAMQFDPNVRPFSAAPSSTENEILDRLDKETMGSRALRIMAGRCSRAIKDGNPVFDWPGIILSQTPRIWLDDDHFRTLFRHEITAELRVSEEEVYGEPISYIGYVLPPFNRASPDSVTISSKVILDQVNGIDLEAKSIRWIDYHVSRDGVVPLTYLDLDSIWTKIDEPANGEHTELDWQRDIEVNVELRNGDRKFTDQWVVRVSAIINVVDSSHSKAKTEPGNEFDRSLKWSATLYVLDERAWLRFKRDGWNGDDPFHDVLARAVLIGDDAGLDTGVCYDGQYTQSFSTRDIPSGRLRVELRPAPELKWMFDPFEPMLGDVIHIDSVERVDEKDLELRVIRLSQF